MDLGSIPLGADLVGKASLVGGKLVVTFEFQLEGVADMLIDKVEKVIPGDQAALAGVVKATLAGLLK